jgi:hypothetical protein
MALDLSTPFVWGSGGAQMTPTEIEAQRKVAQAMMAKGGDYSPVQSWTQGAARVAQAMFGGLMAHDANSAAKANQEAESQLLTSIIGGGTPSASSVSTASASPVTSAPLPSVGSTAPDSGLSDAIAKVASARGVDPAYMTRLAMVESGGNPNATTSLSSAKGPFQFIDSTAQHYGLTNPTDPAASADAAARLTLDNKAALTQALGREPTPGELYLAHQQGAAGAAKILANPDAPIESVIGTRAAANNGAVPGMTAGQFANKWTSRFSDIGAPQTAQADPAALPANSQPTQGFAIPGATPPAASINPALARAIVSPYTSEGTKKILSLILTQQMAAAQKANDPLHQAQLQKLQLETANLRQTGGSKAGLTPIYGEDAQGNTVVLQPTDSGTLVQPKLPDGVKIRSGVDKIDLGTAYQLRDKRTGQDLGIVPKDLKGAEAQKALGKAQGTMQASLPSDIANANQTVKEIDALIASPGLSSIIGPLDQFRGSVTLSKEGRDALARFNQLKGKAFLSAYATLRGGGQITEVEGVKAENAMARMDRAQSEEDFKAALTDFRDAVKSGVEKMREKAGVAAPGGTTSTGLPWSVE